MSFPFGVVDPITQTLSIILYYAAVAFIATGIYLIGYEKANPKDLGSVLITTAIVQAILGTILVLNNALFLAFHDFMFVYIWLSFALVLFFDAGFRPLANNALFAGITFFFLAAMVYLAGFGIWITICDLSWGVIAIATYLMAHGRVGAKAVGWGYVIQSIYTLLIPAWFMLMGWTMP
jgi:hypothetical protein